MAMLSGFQHTATGAAAGREVPEDAVRTAQERIYSMRWDEYGWNGERLYPTLLPLEKVLSCSTARLHTPYPPNEFNVIGTPRSGTKWVQKVLELLIQHDCKGRLRKKIRPLLRIDTSVRHFHEGVVEDFSPRQKIVFVYRDIRDAIVSAYHYIRNDMHPGTMTCTPDAFAKLSKEEALEQHIILYMKYRMPAMVYWLNVDAQNLAKIRYEDMLTDREGNIRAVIDKFGMRLSEESILSVVEQTSFRAMSGRREGTEDVRSHQRKGVAGDWVNHFTERHVRIFRAMGGEDLLRMTGHGA